MPIMARTSYSHIHYDPTVEMFFHNNSHISEKYIAVGDYDCTKDSDLSHISEYSSRFDFVVVRNGEKALSKISDDIYGFSSLAWLNATSDLKLSEI